MDLSNAALEKIEDIQNINKIVRKYTNRIEGNCLYRHRSDLKEFEKGTRYDNKLILRQNIYKIAASTTNVKNVLEIGLNGGHSMAIFFLANPNLNILSFDICEHKYVEEVATYFKDRYNFTFVKGDSLTTVKNYESDVKYDVIHIDGGHYETNVRNDLINCKKFAHENTLMIFDDSNAKHIGDILDEYCKSGIIEEINYRQLGIKKCYFHRIFKYCI
jgi:predicted O-methyltransferase YrrM